jgi:hypothetical protein
MLAATLLPVPKAQFFSNTGQPLAGGLLYTAQPGTFAGPGQTFPKATYTDITGLTANPNPVVLDGAGRANIWIAGFYKLAVYDSLSNLIYTQDNVSSGSSGSSGSEIWTDTGGTGKLCMPQLVVTGQADDGSDIWAWQLTTLIGP